MLHFLTPATPLSTKPKTFLNGLYRIKELGLDGVEIPFGRGIFLKPDKTDEVRTAAQELGLQLTIHAPYYINLNSHKEQTIEASIHQIVASARIGEAVGAKSVCFHAGFRTGNTPAEVEKRVFTTLIQIAKVLTQEEIKIDIRPETAGKYSQYPNLEEVLALCATHPRFKPCIDFAHLMATSSGRINSYEQFCQVLDLVIQYLGKESLHDMHIHAGSVAYGSKGEIKALNLDDPESTFNYRELLEALLEYDVSGWIVAETPKVEEGVRLLKETYKEVITEQKN